MKQEFFTCGSCDHYEREKFEELTQQKEIISKEQLVTSECQHHGVQTHISVIYKEPIYVKDSKCNDK